MKQALLIVDVQNDFLPGGALPAPGGDEVIPVINRLIDEFPLVIASKEVHPKEHVSFATTHEKKAGERVRVDEFEQILWPDHCVEGSFGAEFPVSLNTQGIDRVIEKGIDPSIDSYSAFFDNLHRRDTGLDALLRSLEVNDLLIVGIATDYCVKYTALDACALGYSTSVDLAGCRGIELEAGDVDRACWEMELAGVQLISQRVK